MDQSASCYLCDIMDGASWLFGLLMVIYYGWPGVLTQPWFLLKFVAILAMSAFHYWLKRRLSEFANDQNTREHRTYRIANEVPTVLMIVIVIMVIVQPF